MNYYRIIISYYYFYYYLLLLLLLLLLLWDNKRIGKTLKSGIKSFVFTGFNSYTFIYSSFIIQSNAKYTMGCKDCSNPQKSNHVFWFCLVLFLFLCVCVCVCV